MDVVAGFVTHSGWAVAVVVGLVGDQLHVCDRRRVELVSPDLPRQAYHAAADLPSGAAEQLVAAVDASIGTCSLEALSALRDAASDDALVAVGVVGPVREIPDVATVLASHGLMHASEGEQYRRGVTMAAERLGLPVRRQEAGRLATDVAEALRWPASRLADEHNRLRTALGPPWQKDHKLATEVALVALRSAA